MKTRLCKLPEWARWIAQDADGRIDVYECEPIPGIDYFGNSQIIECLCYGRPNPYWRNYCRRLTPEEIRRGEVLVRVW